MYHDGIAASNTLKPPMPRGSTTPLTMATAFHPIEKIPSTSMEGQDNAGAKSATQITKYKWIHH